MWAERGEHGQQTELGMCSEWQSQPWMSCCRALGQAAVRLCAVVWAWMEPCGTARRLELAWSPVREQENLVWVPHAPQAPPS